MTTPAAQALANVALRRIQDPQTGRARVEDYLTVLAAMTGEAALVDSGVIDIETTELAPGSRVFGDAINVVLTGDTADLAAVPAGSVVGILVAELVPERFDRAAFDILATVYGRVAEHVGTAPWGSVEAAVPPDNQPSILPLQVAFELRPAVDRVLADAGLPPNQRHVPCAQALAEGLRQVRGAIDPGIAVRLALDVVFTLAKTVPMSRRAFEAMAKGPGAG
jgi:hypothetical protein